jgi:hypothetical protein
VLLRNNRTRKPNHPARVNMGHPRTRGLVAFMTTPGGRGMFNAVDGQWSAVSAGTPEVRGSPEGATFYMPGTVRGALTVRNPASVNADACTLIARVKVRAMPGSGVANVVSLGNTAFFRSLSILLDSGLTGVAWGAANNNGLGSTGSSGVNDVGLFRTVGVDSTIGSSPATVRAFLDGVPAGTNTKSGSGLDQAVTTLYIGRDSTGYYGSPDVEVLWVAAFDRTLSAAEHAWWHDHAFEVLQGSAPRMFALSQPASGGIASGAGAASFAFAASGVGQAVRLRRARPWAWDNVFLSFNGVTLARQRPEDIARQIGYEVFFTEGQAGTAVGASSFAFSAAGVGAATKAGTGALTFTFTPTGVGASTFAAPGSASFAFTPAGVGTAVIGAAGATTFTFAATAVGDTAGSIASGAGASSFAFTPAAVGASTWAGVGATSFAFSPAGVGASTFAGAGSTSFAFAASGVGDTAGSVASGAGAAAFAFTPAGVGASTFAGAGVSAFAFAPAGVGASTSAAVGSVTFSFAGAGVGSTAGSVVSGAGASSFAFAGAGAGASTAAAGGSVTFSFAAGGVGASFGVVSAAGAASFSFSAAASSPVTQGVGYYLPPRNLRREDPVVPRAAFAPGVQFRARALLLTSGASAQGAATGFDAGIVARVQASPAKGAARVPSRAAAPRASLRAGTARVDLRLSMDEVAALLVAAL